MAKSKIVSGVRVMIPTDLKSVPEHMSEQWARTQKNVVDITEHKRSKVIPNEMAYLEKMAGVSSAKYADYVSPTYISRKGKNRDAIVVAQFENMSHSYQKYRKSLDHLTETIDGQFAKRFTDKINVAKEIYSRRMAQKGYPFTGEKTTHKSVCAIVPHWLTGDMKIVGQLAGTQVTGGGPVNVVITNAEIDLRSDLKAALSSRLLKSGVVILNAKVDPDVTRRENNNINRVIWGMQDLDKYAPFETGGASHCDYLTDEGLLYLEIQVSVK